MGDIESPSHSTHYAMPISEVSLEELLMIAAIMGPFLFCFTAADGKGEGPSYKGLRIKKFR